MGATAIIGGGVMAAILADLVIQGCRTKQGWSPRQQQRNTRFMFYYMCALVFFVGVAQLFTNTVQWRSLAWWSLFLLPLAYVAFRKPSVSEHLQNHAQDPGHCGQCGYDLTGNVSGICPECGWSIPAAPVQAESLVSVQWWNGWKIAYLEDWRRSLLSLLVLVVAFGGSTVWFLCETPVPIMAIVPGLMAIHLALNIVRVIAYGRRQRDTSRS